MQINHKLHVAFIVDGNGRWAKARNKPRTFGHKKGVERLEALIEGLKDNQEIGCLSFYLFSLENWKRSSEEINYLFKYLVSFLKKNAKRLTEYNLRFKWTGFKEKLSNEIINLLIKFENDTKNNTGIIINFVFNYGGIQDIIYTANKLKNYPGNITKEIFLENSLLNGLNDVDLLIRTSGEQRISNYLMLLLAYTEFIFEPTKFPDYTLEIFYKNLEEFKTRDIRKGGYSKKDDSK